MKLLTGNSNKNLSKRFQHILKQNWLIQILKNFQMEKFTLK